MIFRIYKEKYEDFVQKRRLRERTVTRMTTNLLILCKTYCQTNYIQIKLCVD